MTTVKFYIYTDDYSSYEAMTESVIERFKIEYPEAQSNYLEKNPITQMSHHLKHQVTNELPHLQ